MVPCEEILEAHPRTVEETGARRRRAQFRLPARPWRARHGAGLAQVPEYVEMGRAGAKRIRDMPVLVKADAERHQHPRPGVAPPRPAAGCRVADQPRELDPRGRSRRIARCRWSTARAAWRLCGPAVKAIALNMVRRHRARRRLRRAAGLGYRGNRHLARRGGFHRARPPATSRSAPRRCITPSRSSRHDRRSRQLDGQKGYALIADFADGVRIFTEWQLSISTTADRQDPSQGLASNAVLPHRLRGYLAPGDRGVAL